MLQNRRLILSVWHTHHPPQPQMPAQFETDFVGAVFRLGLKCSSPKVRSLDCAWMDPSHHATGSRSHHIVPLLTQHPKVLMEHMPRTDTLTTEHIKSHLQKYRLHGNRYACVCVCEGG